MEQLQSTLIDSSTTFIPSLLSSLKEVPDYFDQIKVIDELCRLETYSLEKIRNELATIYEVSKGTHSVFSILNGPKILSQFKMLAIRSTNLCIYKNEEIDFV